MTREPSKAEKDLESQEKKLADAIAKGSTKDIARYEDTIVVLKRKIKSEEIRPHPSSVQVMA